MAKQFRPQLLPSIVCLFVFLLLLKLGLWQIHRYEYKKNLMNLYHTDSIAPPLSLAKINTKNPPEFQRIQVEGRYLNKIILLDHSFHDDQLGYEVLNPFAVMGTQQILLVNRGWIPLNTVGSIQAHNLNPKAGVLTPVANHQKILGYIKLNEYTFTIGPNSMQPNQWPLIIQKIDLKQLQQLTHWSIYPFTLRLDPQAAHGFVRAWPLFNLLPQRHMAYAVQWFLMAIVLFIAYIFFSFSDTENDRKN